jgi:hypothetical protein
MKINLERTGQQMTTHNALKKRRQEEKFSIKKK